MKALSWVCLGIVCLAILTALGCALVAVWADHSTDIVLGRIAASAGLIAAIPLAWVGARYVEDGYR